MKSTSSPTVLTTRPPAGGDDVRRQALEALDQDAQLALFQPLRQAGVRHEVGEAHGERRRGGEIAGLGGVRQPGATAASFRRQA